MKPHCERCGKGLQTTATDALICSFECTFCAECATHVLETTCPNCGGEWVRRPTRRLDKD
ncbi:DUF1272 domain-containing protein [Musicola keenii]|uniref:DUF1272 domain-containing protein n=1 Tax=Musicola keenii TaxID=2884250 RepID=UPI001CE337F5|nr:DUF1272 domain-containing protein [Musicola keenii]